MGSKSLIARELSSISPFFDHLIELLPQSHSRQDVLQQTKAKKKSTVNRLDDLENIVADDASVLVLMDGLFNHHTDLQLVLEQTKKCLNRESRVFVVAYNPYMRFLYQLATLVGIREGALPTTFLTKTDLNNLALLTGYSVTQVKGLVYFPFTLFGLGRWLNGIISLIPIINLFSLVHIIMLSPVIPSSEELTLSVVIPARNEKGNIENAIKGLESWNKDLLEIIFVEGHSTDKTMEEIQRIQEKYLQEFNIKSFQQTGKGKNDAVRLGFKNATGDLFTILDADLTVPPESLHRFYAAYMAGVADFVNGSRLLYPMEKEAMRPLNRMGNVFFAKALSYVLNTHIGDSLCGTKLFSKADYHRYVAWREIFGDFDPFGDFELLFPAALLGSKIVDVPISYRARTYGRTNIDRFRHGFMLLKLTLIGLMNIKLKLFR
jgi:hypothetical protein